MKQILLLAVALFLSFGAMAQTQHFTFRDIPINGTVEEVGAKLKELGYTPTDSPSKYTGQFIGEDCAIYLLDSDYTKMVYSIVAQFEPASRWSSLKADFREVKELCTSKYGKPTLSRESFSSPYYDGDGYEMTAVKVDKCNYVAQWKVENGEVTVLISKSGSIAIYYTDKTNEELDEKAKQKTAESEI